MIKQIIQRTLIALCIVGSAGCATTEIQTMQGQLDSMEGKIMRLEESIPRDLASNRQRLQQISERLERTTTSVKDSENSLRPDLENINQQILNIGSKVDKDHAVVVNLQGRMDAIEDKLGMQVNTLGSQLAGVQTEQSQNLQTLRSDVDNLKGQINGVQLRMDALDKQMDKLLNAIGQVTGSSSSAGGTYDGGDTYVVAEGDTLSRIAQKTGASTRAIQDANGITDPSKITVGKTLKIPK